MADELTSPSVKSGNVLALLNTLYTSGFAMASSSTPLLKGKTLHTLYALSFVVYVINSICSWLHISFVVKGYVTSFPLSTWIIVSLVVTAVCGSMLTWLLLVLCIENAFAHRLDITPYRSGCALVFEAFLEWTQAFNNFRMSFLIMILHDTPMTIFNYVFIAACRCPNPNILSWPLVLSSFACTISLLWRLAVLYFSYKRMLCGKQPQQPVSGVAANVPIRKHFESAIDTSTASVDGRLGEYDETWPIRWARLKTIGPHPDYQKQFESEDDGEHVCNGGMKSIPDQRKKDSGMKNFMKNAADIRSRIDCQYSTRTCIGYTFWIILSTIMYIFWVLLCCIPCIYHYTCRHNSFYHRHKFCRSFIRYFSMLFHNAVFYFSLIFSLILIGMNIVLLSSVHALGSNNIPPEIDQICVTVSLSSNVIYTSILPASPFQRKSPVRRELRKNFSESDKGSVTECKPLWEDGGLGMGLARKNAGAWEMRTPIGKTMLAVATLITFNNTDIQRPTMKLEYTHTLFVKSNNDRYACLKNSGWKIIPSVVQLSWPYFTACEQSWEFSERPDLIRCNQIWNQKHHTRHQFHYPRNK